MRITRIRARDFRAIEQLDEHVGEGGLVVKGRNGAGKTSVLAAIHAALSGRGVSPDAVRLGAERAVVEVDLGDVTVRRLIPRDGRSTLSIKGREGERQGKPQTWLDELIGPTLDPLDLWLGDKRTRRARILEATPARVTVADLRRWAPDLPDTTDVQGHALDVIARVRASYYDRRHEANSITKRATADAERLRGEWDALVLDALRVAGTEDLSWAPTPNDADTALQRARASLTALETRDAQARKAADRATSTQAKITELRARETAARVAPDVRDTAQRAASDAVARIATLETELVKARDALRAASARVESLDASARESARCAEQAATLEATLADLGASPIDPFELDGARDAVADAEHIRNVALASDRASAAKAALQRAEATAAERAKASDELDAIVRALTDDAPRTLLERSGAIPGLGLDGDDITLDGKSLDALCGQEQLALAVEIAKRANAKREVRLLVVDGLERLDPAQMDAFVREATSGGWQLCGTRVDAGEIVIEAIEPGDTGATEAA